MKGTPGPWRVRTNNSQLYREIGGAYFISGPNNEWIARLTDETEPRLANARLIAAAPDLLEASTNLVGAIRILENLSAEGKDTDDAWSEVVSELLETQAVIAKATSKATTQNP